MLKVKHKRCIISTCKSDSRTIDKDVCSEIMFVPFPQVIEQLYKFIVMKYYADLTLLTF